MESPPLNEIWLSMEWKYVCQVVPPGRTGDCHAQFMFWSH